MKMSSLLNDGGGVTINPVPSLSEQQGIMMERRGRGEEGGDGQRANVYLSVHIKLRCSLNQLF
jgi:hypothetical protein